MILNLNPLSVIIITLSHVTPEQQFCLCIHAQAF